MYSANIFFELNKPDGGTVSQSEWLEFVEESLLKNFSTFSVVDSTRHSYTGPRPCKMVTAILQRGDSGKGQTSTVVKDYCRLHGFAEVLVVNSPSDPPKFIVSEKREQERLQWAVEREAEMEAAKDLKHQINTLVRLLKYPTQWIPYSHNYPTNNTIDSLVALGLVKTVIHKTLCKSDKYKIKLKSIVKAQDFIQANTPNEVVW